MQIFTLRNLGTQVDLAQNERKSMSKHSNVVAKCAETNCQVGSYYLEANPQATRTLRPRTPTVSAIVINSA